MFLTRNNMITGSKFISLLFVCSMMFVFLRVLIVDEQAGIKRKCLKKEKNHSDQSDEIVASLDVEVTKEKYQTEYCVDTYLIYYIYAIILGAYVNVKKLYKMGPI